MRPASTPFRGTPFVGWLALCLAGTACPALAQSGGDVDRGEALYMDADFDGAQAQFEAVLQSPALTPADAAKAHTYLATLHALMGRAGQGSLHAAAAVALDPEAQPPEGAGPDVEALFRLARQAMRGRVAEVHIRTPRDLRQGEPGAVQASLEPAPELLAVNLRLRCGEASTEGATPRVRLELTPEGRVSHCEAAALTAAGARLVTSTENFEILPAIVATDPEGASPGWLWPVVGVGAGVVVVTTLIIALLAGGGSEGNPNLRSTAVEWN